VDPAGGAHHTGFSYAVTAEHLRDFAEIAGIEFVLIDGATALTELREGAPLERGLLPVCAPRRAPRLQGSPTMLTELKREAYEANLAPAGTASST
jgi:hypothetical protein